MLSNNHYEFFAEICCGTAEGLKLFDKNYKNGIGVDISIKMLNSAFNSKKTLNCQLIQGDAINLPLKDNVLDCVLMLGGIHHINQRNLLFKSKSDFKTKWYFYLERPSYYFFYGDLYEKLL